MAPKQIQVLKININSVLFAIETTYARQAL